MKDTVDHYFSVVRPNLRKLRHNRFYVRKDTRVSENSTNLMSKVSVSHLVSDYHYLRSDTIKDPS